MYEDMTIATSIQEVMNYPDLEYYHYKLMEYLKARFEGTASFAGVIENYTDLPESTDENPIQDGTIIVVSGPFSVDGQNYPNGGTLIYKDGQWVVVNATNLTEDAVWKAIGNGANNRKVFSIPEGESVLLAFSAKTGNQTYTDIVSYTNAGKNRNASSLVTLMRNEFAIYYDNLGDLFVGTVSPIALPGTNTEMKFKVLYSSCEPSEIVWYNTDDNNFTLTSNIKKQDNYILARIDDISIDPSGEGYEAVVADAEGNVDLNLNTKNQFHINTGYVDETERLVINTEGYNSGKDYVIEVSSAVAGLDLKLNGATQFSVNETLYGGYKVLFTPSFDGTNLTWNYEVYKSEFISSDDSIKIEKLKGGGYDITTTASEIDVEPLTISQMSAIGNKFND